ncbi:MAG: hypothetical protein JNJ54_21805 [Myxococcaceae bacterium]|nr:hypothetical protein [Myxococcaceae bacterium]
MKRELAELVKGQEKIRLWRSGRHLTELRMRKTTSAPRKVPPPVSYADVDAAVEAMGARLAELEREGWVDTGAGLAKGVLPGTPAARRLVTPSKRKKKAAASRPSLDDAFAALARETITALERSSSDASDLATWKKAIAAYKVLRRRAGGSPTENLVHFFAVDGVGVERAHEVVIAKVKPAPDRFARWMKLLQAAAI